MEYGRTQTMTFGKIPPKEPANRTQNTTPTLADVIYIFVNKDQPGIMVYDYTDERDNSGKKTVSATFSQTKWNERSNIPGQRAIERFYDGTRSCLTYMVTEEELAQIIAILKKAQAEDKIKTFIDFNKFINKKNYNTQEEYKQDININQANYDINQESNYNKHTR